MGGYVNNEQTIIILSIIGLMVICLINILRTYKRKSIVKDIRLIDNMKGVEFEELLKTYFEGEGYRVELTPKTNDYGADLVIKKKGERTVVQAKRYKNKVGNKAVQEVVSAKPYYRADKAMVVTNSYFTKNAINLARANKVVLWDRDTIKKILL